MTAALIDAGRGADLLRSKLEELAHVAAEPIPQFIQSQIAQARQQDDPGALRAALGKARTSVEDALDEAKELRGPQKEADGRGQDAAPRSSPRCVPSLPPSRATRATG